MNNRKVGIIAAIVLVVLLALVVAAPAAEDQFDTRVTELMMSGYRALEHEKYEQALEYLEQARKLDKKSVVLRTLYGEVLYELGRYQEVVDLLKGEIREDRENDIDILRLLAFSYEELGQNDKAIDRFKAVIEQAPDDEWNRRRLLELLQKEERFQELIVFYKPLLDPEKPSYAVDLFHMGALYLRIGGKKPAAEYLAMSLEVDSTVAESYQLLGNIAESENRWDEALDNYLKFLSLRPDDAEQMLPRVLTTARQTLRTPAGEEGEPADSAAWVRFFDRLEQRQREGERLDKGMKRVMAIGAEAIGRLDRAIEINRQIADEDSTDEFSQRSLLRLYYATRRYAEMIPIYEKIIDPSNPSFPGDMLQLGALYLKSGELDKGRHCLESALETDETLGRAHQMLGHLDEQQEHWDEALEHYVKFVELEPGALRETFDRLAETSLKARRPELTVDILEQAIAAGDTTAWTAEQLGWMYFNVQRFDESYSMLNRLGRSGALSENGLYVLGLVEMRREEYKDAAESFAAVIERAPGYFLSYLARSNALMLLNEPGQAGEVLRAGLARVDSSNAEGRRELMYSLANVCHELDDGAQTEKWLQKVLELSPDYAPALNYLGYYYAEQGRNLDEAYKLIERALAKEPENPHYLDSMGWVLYKQGNTEKALDYILNSLETLRAMDDQEKAYSEVYEHLGDIYLTLGKTELAREAWHNSLEIDRENREVEQKLNDLQKRQE